MMGLKSPKNKEQPPSTPKQPPFHGRKTMADLVRERMAAKKRKSYFHRIVILTEHKNFNNEFIPSLKEEFNRIQIIAEDNILNEKVTGLVFYYSQYSAIMLAGSEDCVAEFIKGIVNIQNRFFAKALIILFSKNINHLFFNQIIWKTGDPPTILEAFSEIGLETIKKHHNALVKQLYNLWAQLRQDLESGDLTLTKDWLTTRYSQNMLVLMRIEYVLSSKALYTLSDLPELIFKVPPIINYDEIIWPIPDDFIPRNIIDLGPYDVNLLFPNWETL